MKLDPKIRLGGRYVVPVDDGEAEGTLTAGMTRIDEREFVGAFKLDDGRSIVFTMPIDDDDIAYLKDDPDIGPKGQITVH